MPSLRPLALLLLAAPLPALAQVSIDAHGIRAGGTTIDATGVHARGANITARGVRAARPGGGRVINTNDLHQHINCAGGDLTVNGNDNQLTVANCRAVVVAGNDNVVDVRFAAPGQLTVAGNDDRVSYTHMPHVAVSVTNVGNDSTVSRR